VLSERQVHQDQVLDATPAQTTSILLGATAMMVLAAFAATAWYPACWCR
jgi:hypothetical protein